METIKLKFRPSLRNNGGFLYFRIIHKGLVRRLNTNYFILSHEWDSKKEEIVCPEADSPRYNILSSIMRDVDGFINKYLTSVESGGKGMCCINDFIETVQRSDQIFDFLRLQVDRLFKLNRIRSSEIMKYTLHSFMQFRGGIDLRLSLLTKEEIEQYEAWLKTKGVKRNTSSFYMRNLRAAYRIAVDQGLTKDNQPFRKVYTGIDKTMKRAITIEDVRKIKNHDFSRQPTLDLARDVIMFSFYMRGMSFVDITYLKKKDMHENRIIYKRKKTNKELNIEVPYEALEIIGKYENPTEYLLPLITEENGRERQQYKNKMTIINRNLKKVGDMLGISIPLSTYVMRHTWATIARDKGVELSVISEALGHDNEMTTRIYLDSISLAKVDKANRSILDDL